MISIFQGLWLVIPAFVCIAIAREVFMLYFGVFLFAVCKNLIIEEISCLIFYWIFVNFNGFFLATAMVVTCMMTLVTRIGPENQKGAITGIFRSLGALARACGPIVASIGNSWAFNFILALNSFWFYNFKIFFQLFGVSGAQLRTWLAQ